MASSTPVKPSALPQFSPAGPSTQRPPTLPSTRCYILPPPQAAPAALCPAQRPSSPVHPVGNGCACWVPSCPRARGREALAQRARTRALTRASTRACTHVHTPALGQDPAPAGTVQGVPGSPRPTGHPRVLGDVPWVGGTLERPPRRGTTQGAGSGEQSSGSPWDDAAGHRNLPVPKATRVL